MIEKQYDASSTVFLLDILSQTSTKAPSSVRIRAFGPLLHLPKQLTLTTGTDGGVKKVKVANVASDPFSRHLRYEGWINILINARWKISRLRKKLSSHEPFIGAYKNLTTICYRYDHRIQHKCKFNQDDNYKEML